MVAETYGLKEAVPGAPLTVKIYVESEHFVVSSKVLLPVPCSLFLAHYSLLLTT